MQKADTGEVSAEPIILNTGKISAVLPEEGMDIADLICGNGGAAQIAHVLKAGAGVPGDGVDMTVHGKGDVLAEAAGGGAGTDRIIGFSV